MSDETLFAAALDQSGPAARAAYLDSACTDPEVRRRIEALLAAHDRAGDFLARPAVSRPAPESGPTRDFAPDAEHTRTHGGTVDTDTDEALGFLAPARRADSLGRIGHYEVLEVLGRGGFGIVLRAFDETLQRVVAVKVLAPSMAATSPARKRFLREARHAGNVRHENVVQIHDISRDEERLPYLVMEFIPGETLQQRLDRTGPLDVAEILRIGRQIASGLAAAHDMGLIHRDIKPSNILIDTGPQERVKITDFGLARAADDASISQSGVVAGTPMYMAPEQAKGDALDHRADLFSLGSVLYVMCTGRPPFRAESTLAVLKRVAEDNPRPIREIIPEVPDWLCRIIEKLHAKDPAERYQSAKEVAEVLADCERQLAAHKEVTDYTRIPGGAAPSAPVGLPPKSKELLAAAGALMLFAFVSMYGLSEQKLLGRVFWLPVLVVGLAGVLLWAAAPRSSAPRAAKAAPTRSGRWKWAGTAAALVLLGCWAAWAGPFAYRYLADRGTISFAGQATLPELDRVLVKRDGEVVATLDWLHPDAVLPPGDYELESVAADGYEVTKFYTETTRLFSEGMLLQRVEDRPVLNLTVRRGDAITVQAAMERRTDLSPPPRPNEGWVSLFNGKDLSGWTPSPNSPGDWRVEDGALVGRRGPGYLFGAKTYENFHLRVEAKFNAAGNSGVSFRRRLQVEFRNDPVCPTGTLLEVLPARTTPLVHYPQTEIPQDTWFTLEILAEGPSLSVRVNDGPWIKGQDARAEGKRAGPLELEVGPETVVRFRKIEIKELPPPSYGHEQPIPGWGNIVDPKRDCKFSPGADGLTITVPAGKYNLNPTPEFNNLDAPRVLRNASGDFQFEARVDLFPLPQAGPVGVKDNYAGAGLVIWQDERNFVRFVRAGNGETSRVFVHLEHIRDGRNLSSTGMDIANRPVVLRAARTGDAVRFYWSADGATWREHRLNTPARLADKLQIGVCAINTTQMPLAAKFSQPQFQPNKFGPDGDTFVPLFNGKGTTGWSGKFPEAWSVENGVLIGRGQKGSADGWSELIHSRNDYQNFHLRVEAKINASGWASIRVRKQKDSLKGYKIWLSNDSERTGARTGRLDADRGKDDLLITNSPNDLRVPVDEWFAVDLIARGPELILSINNKEAARLNDPTFASGEIQLEVAGADTVVQFRKIEIKELPAAKPEVPPAAIIPFDAPKAKQHQEAWARHFGVPVEIDNAIGMKLRLIPAGRMRMGSTPETVEAAIKATDREKWAHDEIRGEAPGAQANIVAPFYMSIHEVTREQFERFVAETQHVTEVEASGKGGLAWDEETGRDERKRDHTWKNATYVPSRHHPVVFVTPVDARAFCDWLSHKDGRRYTLPVEAQWEFACRAGTTTHWYSGSEPGSLEDHEWIKSNSDDRSHAVGGKTPNPFGLFDMLGNVSEVVLDEAGKPVHRGGTSAFSAWLSRSASRYRIGEEQYGHARGGFRVVLVGDLKPKQHAKPDPAVLQPLRDLVAATARSRDQVKARFEAGTVSKIDLLAAESNLDEARIRLAETEGNHADVIALHEALVAHRKEERELIALRVEIGKDAPDVLDQADARLADARVRLAKVKPPAPAAPAPRLKP